MVGEIKKLHPFDTSHAYQDWHERILSGDLEKQREALAMYPGELDLATAPVAVLNAVQQVSDDDALSQRAYNRQLTDAVDYMVETAIVQTVRDNPDIDEKGFMAEVERRVYNGDASVTMPLPPAASPLSKSLKPALVAGAPSPVQAQTVNDALKAALKNVDNNKAQILEAAKIEEERLQAKQKADEESRLKKEAEEKAKAEDKNPEKGIVAALAVAAVVPPWGVALGGLAASPKDDFFAKQRGNMPPYSSLKGPNFTLLAGFSAPSMLFGSSKRDEEEAGQDDLKRALEAKARRVANRSEEYNLG